MWVLRTFFLRLCQIVLLSRLYRAVGPVFGVFGVYFSEVKVISCLLMYKH